MGAWGKFKRTLLGDPLASSREKHERLSIPIALAVFASDALSSTAYATEEILLAVVMAASFAAYANVLSIPVAIAIGLLMLIVVMSYRQVIFAYPQGGGTYEVSKEKLGITASQVAGAALLIDYVLTVAVSVSAGVAAITSTGLVPIESRVSLAVFMVTLIMLINLRGVRESGRVLAFPAYAFIAVMFSLMGVGFWKVLSGQTPPPMDIPTRLGEAVSHSAQFDGAGAFLPVALLLVVLKAFSHGCAALTGIEAISDGVKAFKEPSAENANKTLVFMGVILCSIFIGMTALAYMYHIKPSLEGHETVISMVAKAVFGGGTFMYFAVQIITMVILILAANTSFSGFPRLATILANDNFLPRQLMSLGDRLVFSNGILILGASSMVLIWLYQADTHALIPLYAVGVFLSFTLAQAGMVVYHNSEKQPGYKQGRIINGIGATVTGVVTLILAVEKFTEGAWIVLVAIPLLIILFRRISAHYASIGKQLALPSEAYCPVAIEHTVLVLVSSLHRGTVPALAYAKTLSDSVEAVHVELNTAATDRIKQAWDDWGCGIPLTILKSPYRSIMQPILDYVDEVEERQGHEVVTIIVPEFVTRQGWHNLLHNQTSLQIKALLRGKKGKVVTTVRYHLEE